MVYDDYELDMAKPNPASIIDIPEDGYVLQPNKLYLGRTNEYTKTDGYIPMLEGRSSVGRLGVFIHVTAGFGDVGFAGYWTLEIFCVQPIRIYPNVEICQIYYHDIDGEYDTYQHGNTRTIRAFSRACCGRISKRNNIGNGYKACLRADMLFAKGERL